MADLDRRLSVATNAIAYELYKDDGREKFLNDELGDHMIYTTDEETEFVKRIAERVIHDLREFDKQESAKFFLAGAGAKRDCE